MIKMYFNKIPSAASLGTYYKYLRLHATEYIYLLRCKKAKLTDRIKNINCDINLNAKDVGQQLSRENNDCRVRYKLSVVVASGETFNPEENEVRSRTTKPASNATMCVNMRDRAARTRKL